MSDRYLFHSLNHWNEDDSFPNLFPQVPSYVIVVEPICNSLNSLSTSRKESLSEDDLLKAEKILWDFIEKQKSDNRILYLRTIRDKSHSFPAIFSMLENILRKVG